MFLGALGAAGFSGTNPEDERDPPPEPTPVTFPSKHPREGVLWKSDVPPPNFQSLFSKVLKPIDISREHLESLNITILPPCRADELIPPATDGTSYFPDLDAKQAQDGSSDTDTTNTNPADARKRKDMEDRLSELRIDNDLAFRVLTRNVVQGVKPPRLAYMRRFWEGLENMSQYWDCSLDQYYERPEDDESGEKTPKRQRLENEPSGNNGHIGSMNSTEERTLPILESTGPPKDQENRGPDNSEEIRQFDPQIRASDRSPGPRIRMRYKGRRTSTGRMMPDQFRSDTVRAFVEGTIWPFQASLMPPRIMPLVQFNKLNLPVRQTAAVYRLPTDRTKGRQGWLLGPMVGVQVRSETDFDGDDGQNEVKARLDMMREIGGLMQLAQERRREGKTEVKPGEGKWWTSKPRWGGGPGGDPENEVGNSDVVQAAEELLDAAKESKTKDVGKSRKKKTPALLWKELKSGKGYWDPKTEYTAIGKSPKSDTDVVFLVSSLNHHISIVKLTVHDVYMDYITSASLPDTLPDDGEWSKPMMQRTEWFDLFDIEQRVEAFRALWGVMAYLTRDVNASGESKDNAEKSVK